MAIDMTSSLDRLLLNLVRDSDFVRVIETTAGETFPAGAQLILDFGATEWPATVTSTEARWEVDKATVNALIPTVGGCVLRYVHGTVDLVWAACDRVSVNG